MTRTTRPEGAGHNLPPAPSAQALATLARAAEAAHGLAAILGRATGPEHQAAAQAHKRRRFGRGSSTWSAADETRLAELARVYLARHRRDIGARAAKLARQRQAVGTIEAELAAAGVAAALSIVDRALQDARAALALLDRHPTPTA